MTLAEAAAAVGRKVVYQPRHLRDPSRSPEAEAAVQSVLAEALPQEFGREIGEITSVTSLFVFVRYGTETHSKATLPEDLDLDATGAGDGTP